VVAWLVAVGSAASFARAERPPAPQAAEAAAVAEARATARTFGGSCEDVSALQRLADTAPVPAASRQYREAAQERREAALAPVMAAASRLARFSAAWWKLGDRADGTHSDDTDPKVAIAAVREDLGKASCYAEPSALKRLTDLLASLEQSHEQFRATELGCRKVPACRARRVAIRHAAAACGLADQERAIVESIREERANPAGVVSLATLHDLGDALRATREELGIARAEFARLAKQPFRTEICKDVPVDPVSGEYLSGPVTVELEVEPSAP